MKADEIKRNLNHKVKFQGTEYILTAGIFRLDKNGNFFYQAELTDIKASKVCENGYEYKKQSVCICNLDDVELF